MQDSFAGVILGTAVGDALGLPREGLTPRRASKMFGAKVKHRFLFGRGMLSDDTEHTCLVAKALLSSNGDPKRFARLLGWKLRFWLLGLPAGIGLATLRSILKLWFGFSPQSSGVYSAGNGPAMRSAVIGVCFASDPQQMERYVRACTTITHTDPKAFQGALLIASAAAYATTHPGELFAAEKCLQTLLPLARDEQLKQYMGLLQKALAAKESPQRLAGKMELKEGVTGYINHTVPLALFCWLRWPHNYKRSVSEMIRLGGDADTTAAITGALAGISCGVSGIPKDWLKRIFDWPNTVASMNQLAQNLCAMSQQKQFSTAGINPALWPIVLVRNLFFLVIVLAHGFRRLLPPY